MLAFLVDFPKLLDVADLKDFRINGDEQQTLTSVSSEGRFASTYLSSNFHHLNPLGPNLRSCDSQENIESQCSELRQAKMSESMSTLQIVLNIGLRQQNCHKWLATAGENHVWETDGTGRIACLIRPLISWSTVECKKERFSLIIWCRSIHTGHLPHIGDWILGIENRIIHNVW